MPTPDPEVIKKVMQWLTFADEDLKIACDAMHYGSGGPYRLIAYHAQQCAEKCLKAFLVFHSEDFPYTHNIRRLLKTCGKHAAWPQNLKDAEELTAFAITTRYPGEYEEVTQAEAGSAIEIAQKVRDRVRTELKQLGMELTK